MTLLSKCMATCCLITLTSFAFGHALWDPQGLIKPRSNRDDIKTGPCGVPRTQNAVTLAAGSTVNLSIERTIYHQGYFRIAFSPANDQGFDEHVLADRIAESSSQRFYTVSVTLPDVTCDACTLQLIQVMLDRNPPTNYYSCADIKLVRDTQPDDTQPPGSVSQVLLVAGDNHVQLNWNNPDDADFAGVLVSYSPEASTAAPEAGRIYSPGDKLGDTDVIFFGNGVGITETRPPGTYYYNLFTFDQNHNYDSGVRVQTTVLEALPNVAPTVSLIAEQNQHTVSTVVQDQGRVTVQTIIQDANTQDRHNLEWTVSDNRLTDLDNTTEQFIFDPHDLPAGHYRITARVTDDGKPPMSATAVWEFSVESEPRSSGGIVNFAFFILLLLFATLRRNNLR